MKGNIALVRLVDVEVGLGSSREAISDSQQPCFPTFRTFILRKTVLTSMSY